MEGMRHGRGLMFYKDGSSYDGHWENNKKQGHGLFNSPDGAVYDGNWEDNEINGQGVMRTAENDTGSGVYNGEWKDGLRHGYGTFFSRNRRTICVGFEGILSAQWRKNMKEIGSKENGTGKEMRGKFS